ncbi:gamma-glutamyl-gamma-aminobutyrate hydrolase family protein [Alkalihalobacterium alkalinitrilicum]|uniref:gamma-glutamyl-gamma-aminobutyrate hydrolase family protein n=1 Tax=Alkalihalobacterium alkalinitrilicum TaxID=427920 RepID=UPI000994AA97|nr:gamma-glutamyl-gamma-aminobutyrate hydrolase family protein [Alkalihalobacterium alkalinitrilicum]
MLSPSKPVIGITSTIENHNNIRSVHVHEKYIQSVLHAGGVPIVLPIGPKEIVGEWVSSCDGFILSSGEDVDPYHFGSDPHPTLQKTFTKRDKMEIELVKQAYSRQKPILAICRGISILNVALGGTLFQDIEVNNNQAIKHFQQAERSEATHHIEIFEDSWLYRVIRSLNIRVNSMHHQAIDKLAPNFKTVARAPDGVIEAIEGIGVSFMVGIQWHPEEMASEDPSMVQLFKAFITECSSDTV